MADPAEALAPAGSLFARLRDACASDWAAYTRHEFVRRLGDGSLPEASFRRYLVQDYLFLIHFARAWALAAFKSDTLPDMRAAAAALSGIVDVEMGLHVEFCRGWGLTEADMAAAPEAMETTAYTRYVIERGMAGDVLDLHVALAPCIAGYGEIGLALASDLATKRDGNPYLPWIEMYSGAEYLDVATGAVAQLDRLAAARGGDARFNDLAKTFAHATRLEAAFWQMGLDAA
jgi:thiaminase/transcriptional activator TenA